MRALKWTGGLILALLVVLALFIAFGLSTLKGPIERAVSKSSGRELRIEGAFRPAWSWVHPRFRAEKVSYANPDWAGQDYMFQADAVEVSIELLPLLAGRVILPEVHLQRPVIDLEIDEQGRKNWLLTQDQHREGGSRISIKALTFDDAQLTYSDDIRDIDLVAQLSTTNDGVNGTAKGTYHGLPATAQARGGPVIALKDADTPYPLDAAAKVGGTAIKAKGTITNVAQLSGLDLAIELKGQTMSELYDVLGIAFPETTPYTTRGRLVLAKGDNHLEYDKFTGTVGESDIAGTLQFELGGKRAFMHGAVDSKLLNLADLGPLVGTHEPKESGVLPDMPFDSDRWDSIDADVRINAGSIKRPKQLPLEHLSTRIQMRDKVLTLEPFEFGLAGGRIAGTIKMDGQKDPIAGNVALRVKDLDLPEFFPTIKEGQDSIGNINGLIELTGRGDSVGELLGTSNGKIGVYLDGGKISKFMMELVAMDIWGVARTKLAHDNKPVDIRCAIGDFTAKDGVLTTNAFVFDTQVVNVEGTGSVNLKSESMDLTLNPHPKDRSVASLNSPLYIKGTFGEPKVAPDWKKMGARGVGAVAMGLLSPFLAVLPLMQEGKDKDSPCQALIAEATKSAKESKADAKAGKARPPTTVSKKQEEKKAAAGKTAPPISPPAASQ
ncbi:MAG: AsmA family protein [Betaproteobacteria bacterium]|nr:AsmA family protein [Betaproteobacteria bacterium]MBV9360362.1 AsmA family protein [Betaproteobacteria bacterium]